MRSVNASLRQIVAKLSPTTPVSVLALFQALQKAAGILEDMHARAAYFEGMLDLTPGQITNKQRAVFDAARSAFAAGSENQIVDLLRYEFDMGEKDIGLMLSARDSGIFNALASGVGSTLGTQVFRGLTTEDITMSLFAGVSPLTNKSLKYGHGRGVFHWLGSKARSPLTLKGIKSIAFKEAKNRTLDIIRGTRDEEKNQLDLYSPEGEEIEDSGGSSSSYLDLAQAIYSDPWVMKMLDSTVRAELTTPAQEAVWTAILQDPDLLLVDDSGVGVSSKALAEAVCQILGVEHQGKSTEVSVGKTFRKMVLPAMTEALADSEVAKKLLRQRHIMELIQEARKRPYSGHGNVPLPFFGEARPQSGPVRDVSFDPSYSEKAPARYASAKRLARRLAGMLGKTAAIELDTSQWGFSSRKNRPSGFATWMFTTDEKSRDYNNPNVYFTFSGNFSDAKKAAYGWAKSIGASRIYLCS